MLYDHAETLRSVAPEDVCHVETMLKKLDAYGRSDGRAPLGHFLAAVIVGDLLDAACQADDVNVKYLRQYVKYVYNNLPGHLVCLATPLISAVARAMRTGKPLTRCQVESISETVYVMLRDIPEREEKRNAGGESGR